MIAVGALRLVAYNRVGGTPSAYSPRLRRYHLKSFGLSMIAVAAWASPRASAVGALRLVAYTKKEAFRLLKRSAPEGLRPFGFCSSEAIMKKYHSLGMCI